MLTSLGGWCHTSHNQWKGDGGGGESGKKVQVVLLCFSLYYKGWEPLVPIGRNTYRRRREIKKSLDRGRRELKKFLNWGWREPKMFLNRAFSYRVSEAALASDKKCSLDGQGLDAFSSFF